MSFDNRLRNAEIVRGIVAVEPAKGNGNVAIADDDAKQFLDLYFCFLPSACGGRVEVRVNGPVAAQPEVSPLEGLTMTYDNGNVRFFDYEQRPLNERVISAFILHMGANRHVARCLGHPPDSEDASLAEIREVSCLELTRKIALLGDWAAPPNTPRFRREAGRYVQESAQDHTRRMNTTLADFAMGLNFSRSHIEALWERDYANYQRFAREHEQLSGQAINFLFEQMHRNGDSNGTSTSQIVESANRETERRFGQPTVTTKGERGCR